MKFQCAQCAFATDKGYEYDNHVAAWHTTVYTIDGVKVVTGLRAWDYDLERVVVDLSTAKSEADGDIWFYCTRDKGGKSLMNGSRLWVRHPSTGEKA